MVKVNPQVRRVMHSPTLRIHEHVGKLRGQGRDVVHFGFGESPFPVPPSVVAELRKHAGDSRYLPSQGLMALRERAASYLKRRFGHDADSARVVVGPGSKELIFDALFALRGDLILPAPSWVSYGPQGQMLGKRVIWTRPDPEGGYRMTAGAFGEACRRSRTTQKVLILNSPCNPTGAVYSAGELKRIARVARRYNVVIVSDEIYAEITFGRARYRSIAAFCPERTLVTNGLSKGFCAGGHRLGILLVPKRMQALTDHLVCIASETFSCVAAPIQQAAVPALSDRKDVRAHVRDTVAIHRMAGHFLWRECERIGLRCPRPEGAFYLFPDFSPFAKALRRRGIRTDEALCEDLLGRAYVALLPGSGFGVPAAHLAARLATVDYDGAAVLKAFRRRRPGTARETHRFVQRHCPNLPEGIRRLERYLSDLA